MQRYAIISNPKAPCWIFNKFLTQSIKLVFRLNTPTSLEIAG